MSVTSARCCLAVHALAWCALAAHALRPAGMRAPAEAECPPDASCNVIDEFYYSVNGHKLYLVYSEGRNYEAKCEGGSMDTRAWPRFPRPTFFDHVRVECALPAGAYARALAELNVLVLASLDLIVPTNTSLTAEAFADLPPSLERLLVTATDGTIELPADALAPLQNLEQLSLDGVVAPHMPPALDSLVLTNSGVDQLPDEALVVINMTLRESNLRSLRGEAPRLEGLWARAPVTLPRAPRLRTLWMCASFWKVYSDANHNKVLWDYMPPDGWPVEAENGQVATAAELPNGFLRGSPQLHTFVAELCGFSVLPADLFRYSDKLVNIYLADNKIEALPSDLFAGLSQLRALSLSNNRLSMLDVVAAPPPLVIRELYLNNNSLGDLCPQGGESILSKLQQLEILDLELTEATHLCADWLRMPALTSLKLGSNNVWSLSCADLPPQLAPRNVNLTVGLDGNPLVQANCSIEDYEQAVDNPALAESNEIELSTEAKLQCDCGAYWLARVLRARRGAVGFGQHWIARPDAQPYEPLYQGGSCASDWLQCIGAGECGLDASKGVELVIGGGPAERGSVPWHAAVYRKRGARPRQICGGSLLSTRVVVSAAHCFWHDVSKQQPAADYAVALGKLYRRWGDPRDEDTQTFEVAELKLPERFQGSISRFQADIALLVLATPAQYRAHIRPLCVDFDYDFEQDQLHDGNLGKVAGWGLTEEDGVRAPLLKVVQLPYVPAEECLADAPLDFKDHITPDKICAGYRNGTAALCEGDSGGGLVYFKLVDGLVRAYLRGIVSTGPLNKSRCNRNWLTTFTLLSYYKDFVLQTLTS